MKTLKQLGIASLILLSFPVLANGQHWKFNENSGSGYVGASTDISKSIWILPNETAHYKDSVRFTLSQISDGICTWQHEQEKRVLKVNKKLVKFTYAGCQNVSTSNSIVSFIPSTNKGNHYILNQFEKKTAVSIDGNNYSAIGFIDTQKKVIAREKAEENAL
ncbi:hypothetical protein [Vibrio sp. ER1A]|uniref:hypothetical protein n=1 Tax=Vibrio sp. ER1A TaxID=1517681 RepID=UPI0004DCCD19|nr:hypothetical protein [Vibrio sp. ER1A]KFA99599.1 hypothetical protein HW45_02745 [Vibrio sp. ER1A]